MRSPTRSDTGFASVDISHITGQEDEDEKRSPTPSPTFTRHRRVIVPEVTSKPRTPTPNRRIKTISPVQKVRTPTPELIAIQPIQHVQRVATPLQIPRDEAPQQNLSLQLKPGYTVIPEIGARNRPVYVPRDNFYRSKSDTEIIGNRPGNERKSSLASAPGDLRQRVKKRKQDEVQVHDLSLAQKIILQRRVVAHWENYHRPVNTLVYREIIIK